MQTSSIKKIGFITILGPVFFLILSTIAMFTYAGGNGTYPTADGYNFTLNFFSDLGIWNGYDNRPNHISSILFAISLTLVGGMLIPYFLIIPAQFTSNIKSRVALWIGSLCGIIASLAYIGIGFTPWDINLSAHMIFVYTAFPISLPLAISYAIGILWEKNLPKRMAFYYFGYILVLGAYLYLLFFGPPTSSETGRMIQVVGQKIIVYSTNVLMIFQGIEIIRLSKKEK